MRGRTMDHGAWQVLSVAQGRVGILRDPARRVPAQDLCRLPLRAFYGIRGDVGRRGNAPRFAPGGTIE